MISVVFLHLQGLIRFPDLAKPFILLLPPKLTSTNTSNWPRPMNGRDFTNRDFNPPEADCGFPDTGHLINLLRCSRACARCARTPESLRGGCRIEMRFLRRRSYEKKSVTNAWPLR